MTVMVLIAAFAASAFCLSGMALLFTVRTAIELGAMQKSTHKIQMVPVDQLGEPISFADDEGFQTLTKEQKERMTRDELEPIQ